MSQDHTFAGQVRIAVTGDLFVAHARLVTWRYGGKVHWGGFVTTDTRAKAVAIAQEPHPLIGLGEAEDEDGFPFQASLRTARSGGLLAATGLGPSPFGRLP